MTEIAADGLFSFAAPLDGDGEARHDVHVLGDGHPILLLQELPGIGPETLALAKRLNKAGFRVYLPHLLGRFGKVTMAANTLRVLCVRREFNVFLRGKQSPIASWMRALCTEISRREDGDRIGVIGMCLTGSFALALMAEDAVGGAVASQPALPVWGKGALHMNSAEIALARSGMEEKGKALSMRFEGDRLVPDTLKSAFQTAFGDVLDWEDFAGRDHSLLTLDFHQPAYDRMESYFLERFLR